MKLVLGFAIFNFFVKTNNKLRQHHLIVHLKIVIYLVI